MLDQCFNEPKLTDDVPNNTYWLTVCVPTNLECYRPAIPELDGDTTADSVQANTILYVATKPEDFEADNAYWLITRTKNSVRQEQYIDVQRTGVPSGMAAGTVRLGASGLTQPAGDSGWGFLAQVAFCSEDAPGTIDKCTCYSEVSSVQTTASFDGVDPDGTASGTLQINFEDQFRRGNTTTTITGGLGLGPIDVWLEGASGSGGRPTIIDTERVLAPQGTNMVFVERAAVGWGGCTEDGGLASYSRQCSTGWWPYEDDPEGFKGQNGWWGFFVHHRTYRVEAFRAGSAPAQ
jgi:hypothetical protein